MLLTLVAVTFLAHPVTRVLCDTDCSWLVAVNDYDRLGEGRYLFYHQHDIRKVADVFKELEDSAIDPNDKDLQQLALRLGHYTGLKPIVTVVFQEPVHSVRQKQEQLEIEMQAAQYKIQEPCDSEEVCRMCWYTPMPFMNGSAVMDVHVASNGLGLPVDKKRFSINVNGYVGTNQDVPFFKIGKKLTNLERFLGLRQPSRPLWYTHNQTPVLILGGVPQNKIVLMSDTGFEDFFPIELAIDSCWIGSVSCPQAEFSSSIVDTISTESTLFIRQNQLVYYFTGHYPILHVETSGSELWTRVLNNVCVKKLNPVFFHKNDTEYVIALGGVFTLQMLVSCWHSVPRPSSSDGLRAARSIPSWNIPSDQGFVMLLGLETYTNNTLIARGLALNPFSKMFYIWGNVILQSGTEIKRVYPSKAWDVYNTLQSMQKSRFYSLRVKHALLTIFYDDDGLQEVNRPTWGLCVIPGGGGRIFLCLLRYFSPPPRGLDYIRFTHRCPFAVVRVMDLPDPQRFTRMEHYRARPPEIMEKTGFHNQRTLTVYQGLIYQLLQLHSSYHRSYADPVHDPTWRWWKNKIQDAEYYAYMASNWKASGGIFVHMTNYVKIYNLLPNNVLPNRIFLDKKSVFTFSVYLSIRSTKQSCEFGETAEENSLNYIWLTVILSHPEYIFATLDRQELISRGSVLYQVRTSHIRVPASSPSCLATARGSSMVAVNLGCPPGKRLAFDITYTKNYTTTKNKRYFDCVKPDPEMPCFFFSDVFYPFFLIQDMVTGDSGRFNGSGFSQKHTCISLSLPNISTCADLWNQFPSVVLGFLTHWFYRVPDATATGAAEIKKPSSNRWACQLNSPCYDIVPEDMTAPDYYFVVMVSNRGVDQTTYCDYALEFILHVHGLRLSPSRALFVLKVRAAVYVPPYLILFFFFFCLQFTSILKTYFWLIPHSLRPSP
uniref:Cation channel sperm-associated protein subunit gamma n=1 Tax=Salvator merianae TaxID=96440 RepID=A0A8D0BL63_SALMN